MRTVVSAEIGKFQLHRLRLLRLPRRESEDVES